MRRLVPFEPEIPAHTNGNGHANGARKRTRRRLASSVVFGVLLGALVATSYVPRLQWLNLSTFPWPGRFAISAALAGALVGWLRRDDARSAVLGGALAGVIAIWAVYALVRISIGSLFVDRSIARVITIDLLRLLVYSAPAGAIGAACVWYARTAVPSILRRR